MDVEWMIFFRLILLFLPGALMQLTDVKVWPSQVVQQRKSTVFLNCVPVGNDKAKVTWTFRDENNIVKQVTNTTKGVKNLFSNHTLKLELRKKTSGQYSCKAVEGKTQKMKTVKVSIAFLNTMDAMKDINAMADTDVNITCHIPTGDPPPSIRWTMDMNKDVPSDSRYSKRGPSLLISKVTREDSHNFTCIAKNIGRDRRQTMTLIVTVPAGVAVNPEKLTVREGRTAVFHCRSLALPPAKTSWKRKPEGNNNNYNPELDVSRMKQYDNGTLVISPVVSGDDGDYQCRSSFPGIDSVFKKKVNLTVNEKLRVDPIKQVSLQRLDFGKKNIRHKVTCYFKGYKHENAMITWSKVGLGKLPNRMESKGSMLYIKDLTKNDGGIYKCTAKGPFNVVVEKINVTIFVEPKFTLRPANTSITEGNSAWIYCRGTGMPEPIVNFGKYVKKGDVLPPNFQKLPNGTLYIKNVKKEDEGEYFCTLGNGGMWNTRTFLIVVQEKDLKDDPKGRQQSMGRTVGIAVGCAGAYIVLVIGLMIYCRSRRSRIMKRQGVITEVEDYDQNKDPLMPNDDYPLDEGNQRNIDKWQFPREDLEEVETLGHGKMGRIFVAKATGIREGPKVTVVAVKEFDKNDEFRKEEFDGELDALAQIKHDNVIKLLGVCTTEYPLYLITEFSEQGDLKQFLSSVGDNKNGPRTGQLNGTEKANICFQIASGMEYLSINRVIHRDLAARNCIVMPSLDIKVAFLSICEDTYSSDYYNLNGASVPLRWLSPEAIDDEDYSDKSDVWAFGVTAWEVYTFGQQPYAERGDEEVLKGIRKDLRLTRPAGCSAEIFKIIESCWAPDPEARPKFDELVIAFASVHVDSNV